jgi:hypothetical protein
MKAMTTTAKLTKVAWIRAEGYPQGRPAPGRLNCPCGKAPLSEFDSEEGNVTCACGSVYTWDGWVVSGPKKVFALAPSEREKECEHEHAPYSGVIPCTGPRVCTMCGTRVTA